MDPRIRLWYTPRDSAVAVFRQYYRYGRWKPAVMRRHGSILGLRSVVPSLFVVSLLALGLSALWWNPARVLVAGELLAYGVAASVAGILSLRGRRETLSLLPRVLDVPRVPCGIRARDAARVQHGPGHERRYPLWCTTAMHDILVLCYHAISSTWRSSLVVKPDELEHQVKTLLGRGYTPTTFSEALSSPARGGMLVVTFDDGFRSVLDRALPVLDRLRVPATMFVSDRVRLGSDSSAAWSGPDAWLTTEYRDELRTLDWPGVSTLADHGWEIGSSHPDAPSPDNARGRRTPRAELRDSKLECERQGSGETLYLDCVSLWRKRCEGRRGCREAGYVFGAHSP